MQHGRVLHYHWPETLPAGHREERVECVYTLLCSLFPSTLSPPHSTLHPPFLPPKLIHDTTFSRITLEGTSHLATINESRWFGKGHNSITPQTHMNTHTYQGCQKQLGQAIFQRNYFCRSIASFPGSCAGEEEREPGTHCSRMRQVPLVTCILLRYTKITVNFCLPPERPHCMVILSLASQQYFSLFPVGGARGREKYVCTLWPASLPVARETRLYTYGRY